MGLHLRPIPCVLGHPEVPDSAGGADLFRTTPDRLTIIRGEGDAGYPADPGITIG